MNHVVFRFVFCIGLLLGHMRMAAQGPISTSRAIDSLKKVMAASKPDSNRVLVLMELVNRYIDFDIATARQYSVQANTLSKQIGFSFGEGRSNYSLAVIAAENGDYQQADSLLEVSEGIFTSLQRNDRLGRTSNQRGSLHFMQGNYWLAADYYAKAADYFEKEKDTINYIVSYQNLIATLAETENYERAIALARKVLPMAQQTTDTSQVFYIMQGLLVNYTAIKKLDSAATYLKPLQTVAANTGDYYIASDIYGAIGQYFEARKDFATALTYFLKALDKAQVLGSKFLEANYLKSVGLMYENLNEPAKALQYLNKAMQLAQASNHARAVYETSKMLSDYYANAGNSKEAFRYLTMHLLLKDSIRNASVSNHVNYLEAKFDNNKKEQQINKLELSNAQTELSLVKRNRALLLGGTGALAVVLLLASLYRQSNHKKAVVEKEQLLQKEQIKFLERQQQVVSLQSMVNGQETERTRIAKDLHDGLGGLFSTVKMYFSTLEHEQQQLKENDLFKKSYEMVDNAATEVRRIAHNMMPEVLLKLGLSNALKDLCNNMSASRMLQVSLQLNGMERRFNPSTEIMLYRIIQELLNNILKHANASEAIVQFIHEENRLSVTVEDNGLGFNTQAADTNKKAGIENVKNRVSYLNGSMSIESGEGMGTSVMMDFLINEV